MSMRRRTKSNDIAPTLKRRRVSAGIKQIEILVVNLRSYFCKIMKLLISFIHTKIALSQMFGWFLNTPLEVPAVFLIQKNAL